jgi:hypothetical protein
VNEGTVISGEYNKDYELKNITLDGLKWFFYYGGKINENYCKWKRYFWISFRYTFI